jgi:hypothetical protein
MNQSKLHRLVLAVALAVTGAIVGTAIPMVNQARGEVRLTPEPDSFKTGGQLSVPILKDISVTLHQIDDRMARLEAVFQKLQATRASKVETSNP